MKIGSLSPRDTSRGEPHMEEVDMLEEEEDEEELSPDRLSGGEGGAYRPLVSSWWMWLLWWLRLVRPARLARPNTPPALDCCWCKLLSRLRLLFLWLDRDT